MSFFDELNELRKRILFWIYFYFLFSLFFFLFGPKEVSFFEKKFFLPLPSSYSFSVQLLEKIQRDLVPPEVKLIVINPISGFLVQIMAALFLGFIFTLPIFLSQILGFITSGLYEKEKKTAIKVLIPSTFLFILGCFFAYFFLIPFTLKILYPFTLSIGVIPFFELNNFLTLIFGLMMGTGIMFLLPIFMILLTWLGLVEASFWKQQAKYAILFFVVFSAIITPDGTGITLLILSVVLTGLYFLGYLISRILKGRKNKK